MVNSGFRDMNETQGPGHQDLGTKKRKIFVNYVKKKQRETQQTNNTKYCISACWVEFTIRWD